MGQGGTEECWGKENRVSSGRRERLRTVGVVGTRKSTRSHGSVGEERKEKEERNIHQIS